MINNFFIPELNNHDVQELWFQDGSTSHTARAAIDLLKDTFGDRLISRFGPVDWPPRSCDLTPLDYFVGAEARFPAKAKSHPIEVVLKFVKGHHLKRCPRYLTVAHNYKACPKQSSCCNRHRLLH
ncbi:hypothetical protein TNCV_3578511 [Trichonephila clavipes]|nr:hypothetical protein TNCV_3578511 [Trichonephila clavipes]